jgi:hypothetical protein
MLKCRGLHLKVWTPFLLQGDAVRYKFVVDKIPTDNTISKVGEWHKALPTFNLIVSKEKKQGAPLARDNALSNLSSALGHPAVLPLLHKGKHLLTTGLQLRPRLPRNGSISL